MALIGYARVSTDKQVHDLQLDALKAAGCDKIFTDTMSGGKTDRPGLAAALAYVREGDILCSWRLDRIGRSLKHLIETVNDLDGRGVGFRSLNENIDTSTAGGRLIFHIFGALAQFERELIKERVNAGLAAARERGRLGGRPKVVDLAKTNAIKALKESGMPAPEICNTLGISRATYYRYVGEGS